MRQTVVIIHGLFHLRIMFLRLEKLLANIGFKVIFYKYSPSHDAIPGATQKLASLLQTLDGDEVFFVTHSMGGLILRSLTAQGIDSSRFRRAVLISPPNHGSLMMKRVMALPVARHFFFRLWGTCTRDLLPEGEGITPGLPRPPCDFGIIAGGRNRKHGYMPFLPGDNDGTISVATTLLDGAQDFLVLPHMHTSILWSTDTLEAISNFLRHGTFKAG